MNKVAEITLRLSDGKLIPFADGAMLPCDGVEIVQNVDDIRRARVRLVITEFKITPAD